MFKQIIRQNITKLRAEKSLTQEELAFFADMQISQWGKCERGEGNPKLSTIRRIAAALGVPLSRLFNEGTKEAPDYTQLGYFIRDCMPYTWELESLYDPLILLDSTGEILLENVTLEDMDAAVQRYYRSIAYKPITRKFKNKKGGLSTGICVEYIKGTFRYVLDEMADIHPNQSIVVELAEWMTKKQTAPENFRSVIETFRNNGYSLQGLG